MFTDTDTDTDLYLLTQSVSVREIEIIVDVMPAATTDRIRVARSTNPKVKKKFRDIGTLIRIAYPYP